LYKSPIQKLNFLTDPSGVKQSQDSHPNNSLAFSDKEIVDILAEELTGGIKPHLIFTPALHMSNVLDSLQSTLPMALPAKLTSLRRW
jgi:hypothetical protein